MVKAAVGITKVLASGQPVVFLHGERSQVTGYEGTQKAYTFQLAVVLNPVSFQLVVPGDLSVDIITSQEQENTPQSRCISWKSMGLSWFNLRNTDALSNHAIEIRAIGPDRSAMNNLSAGEI